MPQETTIYVASFHRAWSLHTRVVDDVDHALGWLSGSTLTIMPALPDESWDGMPACATGEEWEIRREEGLIVRL